MHNHMHMDAFYVCGGALGRQTRLIFGKSYYMVIVISNCTICRAHQKLGIQENTDGTVLSRGSTHRAKERV